MKRFLFLIILVSCFQGYTQDQLYKVTLLRAKPGSLLELIEVIKEDIAKYQTYQVFKPYLLRHSQGDHWDLMVISAIPPLEVYFSKEEQAKRAQSKSMEQPYGSEYFNLVSFQEEAIVSGPPLDRFTPTMENFNLFHIEIFTALVGKQTELMEQRKSENNFYAFLEHRPNLIFSRVFGPSWDIFTLGGYENLHDFAGPDTPFEKEDQAAKIAGFEGVNYIGSYLRSLLLEHHDTLAGKVD